MGVYQLYSLMVKSEDVRRLTEGEGGKCGLGLDGNLFKGEGEEETHGKLEG